MSEGTGNIGGSLRLVLTVSGGRVEGVRILSTRPEQPERLFIGKTPDEVSGQIGSVFSLCGRAQTIASLIACEQALGIDLPAPQAAAREVLRLAEMLSQTVMRLCLSWPTRLGLAANPEPVRACLMAEGALEKALMSPGWKRPGGVDFAPDVAAAQGIVQALDETIRTLMAPGEMVALLRDALVDRKLAEFGPLPADMKPEEGALRRNWDQPSVARMRKSRGAALAARLEAGLCDLRLLPEAMAARLPELVAGPPAQPQPRDSGEGQATVQTARGALTHQVNIADHVIKGYRIDAPTEANFRPGGPVEAGLLEADASDPSRLLIAAGLHVIGIDPCVDFSVEIGDA